MVKIQERLMVSAENMGLLTILYFSFFNNGMMSIMQGAALPYLKEAHNLSYTQSGLMLSAHQAGNLIAVLLAGFLPYAIGKKKTSLLLGSGIVFGMVLITLTGNPWLLVAAYAATGISRGTMSNICNSGISELTGNRTAGLNILHACFSVGALIAPVLLLISEKISGAGWQWAPRMIALVALVGLFGIGRSNMTDNQQSSVAVEDMEFYKTYDFWINTGILFFYLCAESTIIGWFVMYFRDTGRLSSEMAAMAPTALWLMIMIGRFGCAALPEAMSKNRLVLIQGISFTVFFCLMLFTQGTAVCIFCILCIGLSMGGIYPTVMASMKNTSSTLVTGNIIAVASIGGITMPGLVGAVAEARGIGGGISLVMIALAAMVVLLVIKVGKDRVASNNV